MNLLGKKHPISRKILVPMLTATIGLASGLAIYNREPLNEMLMGGWKTNYYSFMYRNGFMHGGEIIKKELEEDKDRFANIIYEGINSDLEIGGEMYYQKGDLVLNKLESKFAPYLEYYREIEQGNNENIDKLINFFRTEKGLSEDLGFGMLVQDLEKVKSGEMTPEEFSSYNMDQLFEYNFKIASNQKLGYDGELMGTWHIHTHGAPPSEQDLISSNDLPILIISNRHKGLFRAYYVKNGSYETLGLFHSGSLEEKLKQ